MNLNELWTQLAEMASSQSTIFEIEGRKITEQQFIWGIVILVAILTIILVRNIALWIVGGTAKKIAIATKPIKRSRAKPKKEKVTPKSEETIPPPKEETSPEKLLKNTSERRRTRYDYVTPDSVQADIMKQTLNNDFPYRTIRPDPSMIGDKKFINDLPKEPSIANVEFVDVPKQPVVTTAPVKLKAAPTSPITRDVQVVAKPAVVAQPQIAPPVQPAKVATAPSVQAQSTPQTAPATVQNPAQKTQAVPAVQPQPSVPNPPIMQPTKISAANMGITAKNSSQEKQTQPQAVQQLTQQPKPIPEVQTKPVKKQPIVQTPANPTTQPKTNRDDKTASESPSHPFTPTDPILP